jgi:hypothetical protein
MGGEFEMSMMGELIFFLKLQIKQMNDDIFISQIKYAKELVKKFGLDDCKTSKTHMAVDANLCVDGGRSTDIHQYRTIIDSLLYLTASRLNIMFSVCLCARYQVNPKESHLVVLKRILRYVKGTLNLGLWYGRQTEFNLIGFIDADFTGNRLDKKVLVGHINFLRDH